MLAFIGQLGHGQSGAEGLVSWVGRERTARHRREVDLTRGLQRVAVRYRLRVYAAFAGAFLACGTARPASRDAMLPAAALVRDGFGFKCLTIMVAVIRRAELELAAGDAQAARSTVEESLAWMRAQGERYWEAEALRVRADAERALGEVAGVGGELSRRDERGARTGGASHRASRGVRARAVVERQDHGTEAGSVVERCTRRSPRGGTASTCSRQQRCWRSRCRPVTMRGRADEVQRAESRILLASDRGLRRRDLRRQHSRGHLDRLGRQNPDRSPPKR